MAVALIATLSPLAAAAVEEAVVREEARRVTAQVERLVATAFASEEFRSGVRPATRRRLDALLSTSGTVGVVQVRLWSRDGLLLYSSTGGAVGQRAPVSEGLRAAVRAFVGATPAYASLPSTVRPFTSDTMYLSAEGYLRYLAFQQNQVWLAAAVRAASPKTVVAHRAESGTARFYLPARASGATVPAGAFEVSYDFRPLERKVAQLQRGVWTGIPSGILTLYGALLALVVGGPALPMRRREDQEAVHYGVFRALASAVDARDGETGDHSGRVASYAVAIGRRLRLSGDAIAELSLAAALHDIGKISVPDAVLRKTGPLTPEEWGLMRRHAVVGSRILHDAPFGEAVKQAVRHVHEWWNGRGYPDRLKGEQIPLYARILAVADAFEAMTSDRPYRSALSPEEALAELSRMRGVQFDPQIVDLFSEWVRGVAPATL
ncbi:MAG: HD-GYP domain-containing protein [Armatimonadota bacterium]|nr:HD-GYP domain-containing protein [Armatimonadota bacterium]MDR7451923.1 HD-GYP domain-containing protein [Armatimonadota bacterium]MDR7466605.1 HD-GYP domain-containing protein [Armatimonadota bacterium]MDR7492921.1 HD-GYP domain-containing protein [Armatimonadota bacterium]MDR7500318.1 HD-GYP domain-containing protein [Armatimonadota bacterium]